MNEKRGDQGWYLIPYRMEDVMNGNTIEKIYLAVQDIRTLAARTRPKCADNHDCPRCPAKITLPDTIGSACLFDLCRRETKYAGGRKRP